MLIHILKYYVLFHYVNACSGNGKREVAHPMKKRLRNLSIATTLTIAVLCEKLVQADLSFQECKNYKIHTRSISLVIDTTTKKNATI